MFLKPKGPKAHLLTRSKLRGGSRTGPLFGFAFLVIFTSALLNVFFVQGISRNSYFFPNSLSNTQAWGQGNQVEPSISTSLETASVVHLKALKAQTAEGPMAKDILMFFKRRDRLLNTVKLLKQTLCNLLLNSG